VLQFDRKAAKSIRVNGSDADPDVPNDRIGVPMTSTMCGVRLGPRSHRFGGAGSPLAGGAVGKNGRTERLAHEQPKSELTDRVRLLTAGEVAGLLGVSVRTVWRWVSAGELPTPIRLGMRATRFRLTDIEEYVLQQPGCQR